MRVASIPFSEFQSLSHYSQGIGHGGYIGCGWYATEDRLSLGRVRLDAERDEFRISLLRRDSGVWEEREFRHGYTRYDDAEAALVAAMRTGAAAKSVIVCDIRPSTSRHDRHPATEEVGE